MKIDVLEKEYMLTPKGNFGEDINFLRGNCLWTHTYMVLKNKYPDIKNRIDYFLDDLTVELVVENDLDIISFGLSYANSLDHNNKGLLIREYEYLEKGIDALKAIEYHIRKDKYVIVQTINERLPFSMNYGLAVDLNNFLPGHAILFIYFDDHYFYYVDDPEMLNTQKISYKDGIYKVKKNDILEAAGRYLNCIIIETVDTPPFIINKENLSILRKSIQNYGAPCKKTGHNQMMYLGREAIKKMIRICKTSHVKSSKNQNLSEHIDIYLSNAFHVIRGSRYICLKYISSAFEAKQFPNREKLLNLFQQEIDNWSFVWGIAEKEIHKSLEEEAVIFDERFETYLSKILFLEEQIIEELIILLG